ncbi:MAG TPA: hypothetical protein EYQ63_25210 [Fuerstia sp.]|nr:hypothetical protein [Fuerstiella sp.]
MKHRLLAFIGTLPLVLAGCCCVPTPVCMQPPGPGYCVPGPLFAPVGPMCRPFAPVMPTTCQPLAYQGAARFPARPHHGVMRHSWPIPQAYVANKRNGGTKRDPCADCRSRRGCTCGDQLHVRRSCPSDCSAPGVGAYGIEFGCQALIGTCIDSGVSGRSGPLNRQPDSGLESIQRAPVPPTPPEPDDRFVEPPPEVRVVVPPTSVRRVNYVSLNSSMPPEDYNRSHTKSAVYETYESTTIPAMTVVHKRIE